MREYKLSGFSDEIAADIKTQFTVLNKLGIGYFEPRGVNGKNIAMLDDAEVAALKAEMDAFGIKVSSIGSPIGKVKLEDDFEQHFAVYKRVVRTAKLLGAPYIRIFSFYHEGGDWTDKERTEILARLKKMIAYAEAEGVILLHENEKDIYGDTDTRCLDLFAELYGAHFKAVFDPANFIQCGVDPMDAYKKLRPYIAYMHIKDALFESGRVVPAGMGDGSVKAILSDLYAGGYDGFLSLEPHLGSFEGLQDLEIGRRLPDLPKGGEGTFTLAAEALRSILAAI